MLNYSAAEQLKLLYLYCASVLWYREMSTVEI